MTKPTSHTFQTFYVSILKVSVIIQGKAGGSWLADNTGLRSWTWAETYIQLVIWYYTYPVHALVRVIALDRPYLHRSIDLSSF